MSYKERTDFEERLSDSKKAREQFPDRIPVIVERSKKSSLKQIDKIKYLVPRDLSVGKFIYVIRKRIDLKPELSLCLYVNDTLPVSSDMMGYVYDTKKDEDGYLYLIYDGENTFG